LKGRLGLDRLAIVLDVLDDAHVIALARGVPHVVDPLGDILDIIAR
jgi:hypothetical protein